MNSVATLAIPDKDAAMDPFVADAIRHAEAIFITGGDQSNYVKYWQGTPVQDDDQRAPARACSDRRHQRRTGGARRICLHGHE